MYTYAFNPFGKAIDDVQEKDLIVLRDVAEGWYVDYKQEGIKTDDLAKHLSAFSNQYGGFLFIGIREAEDGSRKAGTFVGEDYFSLIADSGGCCHSCKPTYSL